MMESFILDPTLMILWGCCAEKFKNVLNPLALGFASMKGCSYPLAYQVVFSVLSRMLDFGLMTHVITTPTGHVEAMSS